jgi:hypothetical protein
VTPLKEALTALADALAKRPAEEILFESFLWTTGRRTLGHPQASASRRASQDRSRLQEHLAKLGKKAGPGSAR